MRALAVLVVVAAVAGCPSAGYKLCPGMGGSDWLCPNTLGCAQEPVYCATMQAVMECQDKPDFMTACTFHDQNTGMDLPGSCYRDACGPCDVDRAGCTYHGWYAMTPVAQDVRSMLAPGISEAYAGGLASSPGAALVVDGGLGWSPATMFPVVAMDVPVSAVAGTSSNVFALASNSVFHYDGTSWQDITPSPTPTALKALCSVGPGKVIAAGALSTVLYYDGSTWATIPPQAGNKPYNAVWATSASDIYVVGNTGLAAHFDGTSWTTIAVDSAYTGVDLNAVWGASSDDVYAVGNHSGASAPNVLHYTGTSFASVGSTASAFDMRSVWGSSSSDVFAVGMNGQILHSDGVSWSQMSVPNATPTLSAVTGSGPDNVFAGGTGGTIWHYAGP